MIKLFLYYLKRFLKYCEAEYEKSEEINIRFDKDTFTILSPGTYHFDGVITWEP